MKRRLLIFLLCVCCVAGCGEKKHFQDLFEKGSYSEAYNYYEDISDKPKYKQEIIEYLSVQAADLADSYNTNKVSYDEALHLLQAIDAYDVDTSEAKSQIASLNISKNNFDAGVEHYEKGEYLQAYQAFQNVVKEDSLYSKAGVESERSLTALSNKVLLEVDQYDYDSALTVMERYASYFDENSEFSIRYEALRTDFTNDIVLKIEALIKNCQYEEAIDCIEQNENSYSWLDLSEQREKASKEWYSSTISMAEEYWHTNCYEEAFSCINNCKSKNTAYQDELCEEYDTIYDSYIKYVINQADEAFGENKDYASAVYLLNHSLFPEDTSILVWIADYSVYEPVYLCELDTFSWDLLSVGTQDNDIATDVLGNVYNSNGVFYREPVSTNNPRAGSVAYSLSGNYSVLRGTIYKPKAILDLSDSDTYYWPKSGVIKIYGDGVCIYSNTEMTKTQKNPIDIEVDITGVRILTIEIDGYAGSGYVWRPMAALADVYVQR